MAYIFSKELVCLIFKSLLDFLTFVKYEGPYFAEGFLLNLCPSFDLAFAQLGVILRTRNKFVAIVAAAECYFVTNQVKNKESKKQLLQICLPVKLADGGMSMKKENNSLYLISNIFSLGKIFGKPFSCI